jgi:hypothetical protein
VQGRQETVKPVVAYPDRDAGRESSASDIGMRHDAAALPGARIDFVEESREQRLHDDSVSDPGVGPAGCRGSGSSEQDVQIAEAGAAAVG